MSFQYQPGSILPIRKIILETDLSQYGEGHKINNAYGKRYELILKLLDEQNSVTVAEIKEN